MHMMTKGEHILVGFSGGADSVCLLNTLWRHQSALGITVSAVHVNHRLRKTADRDESFARSFCHERNIPFYVVSEDVAAYAGERRMTIEEAGRDVRMHAFRTVLKETCADKIALAHHKNDQAETVLFHLCRGTGMRGLGGIRPKNGDIIHPLLCVTRSQIEAYIASEGLHYVIDETNLQNDYTRNCLRNKVLPRLQDKISDAVIEHMAMTAGICRDAQDYLEAACSSCKERCTLNTKEGVVVSDALLCEHTYMQQALLLDVMQQVSGNRKDLGYIHVQDVLSLFHKQVGKRVDLPYEMVARRTYGGVLFARGTKTEKQDVIMQTKVCPDEGKTQIVLPDGRELIFEVKLYDKSAIIPQNQYTKWFDYDRINGHLVVRTRQAGDFFYLDETHIQKVKSYMINEKIPASQRQQIAMICEQSHVLWMVGYRMSSFYQVTKQTKRILEITIRGEK